MTYHVTIDFPLVHIRHDRSFDARPRPLQRTSAPPPAEMSWLSGLAQAQAFDGLNRSWWRWLAPSLIAAVRTWRQRAHTRRELARIDGQTLRDAGIDPGAASFEAAQPFWRPPIRLRETSAD